MTQTLDWSGFLRALLRAEELHARLPADASPERHAELDAFLAMSIAQAYPMLLHSHPDHPDFVPYLNSYLTAQGPNPDNTYLYSAIRGDACYRISGYRGTVHTVDITQGASSGSGRSLWFEDNPGPLVGVIELDQLALEADGRFELIMSPERPVGWTGNWMPLDPRAETLIVRQVACDWENEIDARLAIERLDAPVGRARLSPGDISQRLQWLANYVYNHALFWIAFIERLDQRGVNTLQMQNMWSTNGVPTQAYYDGTWALEEHEALIIETSVPERCGYWNLQLADRLFCGIDMVNRQTSLNGFQARLDSDGRFRAVLSHRDPGVPNWLDTGGFPQGSLVGRWKDASEHPLPSVRKVAVDRVRDYLPDDTPHVTPEARDAALRRRRRAAQLRRRS